jgi:catechol 2,3-dioxygenase-like lactoylglutathione lyase family enzyme
MVNITGSNVTIMVRSMDEAISFYEKIGLTLQNRWGDHYAMMTAKGITLGIHPAKEKNNSSGTLSIGFMVDRMDDAQQALDMYNIPYQIIDDKSGSYLNFKDPDGTLLYFVKPHWN